MRKSNFMPALPENVMPANENDRSFDFVPPVAAEVMPSSVLSAFRLSAAVQFS